MRGMIRFSTSPAPATHSIPNATPSSMANGSTASVGKLSVRDVTSAKRTGTHTAITVITTAKLCRTRK